MRVVSNGDPAALVERLKQHRALGDSPREELEWIVNQFEFRQYEPGELAAQKGIDAPDVVIVLSGRITVTITQASGTRFTSESTAGSVTGVLPFSRMGPPIADAVIAEPSEVLALPRSRMPELIRECPVVTGHMVHVMLDRARRWTGAAWQDEKTMSLGRLAAGLAHELNNPASAASRGASHLRERLEGLGKVARDLGATLSGHHHQAAIERWIARATTSATEELKPIQRVEREDAISAWLAAHGLDDSHCASLVAAGATAEALDELAAVTEPATLNAVIRWLAEWTSARSLLRDVERSTSRVHELVAAVRRFTQLDRSLDMEPTDIVAGLADTIAVWRGKAAAKSVTMQLEAEQALPPVMASPGVLNQAWSNLLENAIDAAPSSGRVNVLARQEQDAVVVCVIDNGNGIPDDVQARMFDPFFTTKEVGQGVGLGLDIVRRVVRMHGGAVEAQSQPGRTELRVTLPPASVPVTATAT